MRILTYKLSMFGNFSAYEATSKNIIDWTQKLSGAGYNFLPSVSTVRQDFASISAQPYTGIPAQEGKRVSFVAPDGKTLVRILAERLDVAFPLEEIDNIEDNFKKKHEYARGIIDSMLQILDDMKGIRLAYYVDIIIPEQGDIHLNHIYRNYNLGLSLGEREDECVEWSHSFNRRTRIGISENEDELCNVVLAMETGVFQQNNKEPEKGLRIIADINTLMENIEERFTRSNFIYFTEASQDIYLDIVRQIIEKI